MSPLHLDNHLLVVDKPPGLLSQADATGDPDLVTLAKAYLKERFDKPGNVFVGLVHRLDRPTSGVVALARTSKAASRLSDQFRRRVPDKTYLAVVEGALGDGGAWAEAVDGIDRGEGGSVRVVPVDRPGSQRAALRWRTLASDDRRSLVEVELATGRKHQIRAQLAARGAPVLGDFRYGNPIPFADGHGIALHAVRLTVEHPTRREPLTVVAPPPSAWTGLFDHAVAQFVAEAERGKGPRT
ncbi:RluA family pseudouridine synthase [Rubrivirga sp.]|uniref:RluA family pseudouridine synthase n=1 Tax=Rubrivirga sp. TaxID=1885344 RepID=UPI003B5192FC